MGKITILLKQHTPMLHFQYEQHGATLRATEVKPKLDKFILTKLGNGKHSKGKEQAEKNNWLISDSALDYKMRITPIGDKKEGISLIDGKKSPQSCAPFFGNIGDDTNLKDLIIYPQGVYLTILTLNSDLEHYITKELICEFFAYTNFGTRQSKGFGSFYIDPQDDYYLPINTFLGKSTILQSFFRTKENSLFADIDKFYKSIRSGVYPFKKGAYVASAMNTYFFLQKKEWDKTTIRKVIDGYPIPKDAILYRDLLGLASLCNYGHKGGSISKEIANIERFKSPIFIKPISCTDKDFNVYIGYFEIPDNENIVEKKVKITGSNVNVKGAINKNFTFDVNTPSKREFDLSNYMNFVFTRFNISRCIKKRNPTDPPCEIEKIYEDLRNNYINNK